MFTHHVGEKIDSLAEVFWPNQDTKTMKKSITTSLLSGAAFALLAASRLEAQPLPSAAPASTGTPTLGQVPIPDPSTTEGFRLTALMSNSFQLQASDLAAAKAKDPATRSYAEKMIPIHEKSTAALTTGPAGGSDASDAAIVASAAKGGRAPLDATFQRMLDMLKTASAGSDFDDAFGRAQIEAHVIVIAAYQTYLVAGTDEALKKFISEALPKMKGNGVEATRLPGGDVAQ